MSPTAYIVKVSESHHQGIHTQTFFYLLYQSACGTSHRRLFVVEGWDFFSLYHTCVFSAELSISVESDSGFGNISYIPLILRKDAA